MTLNWEFMLDLVVMKLYQNLSLILFLESFLLCVVVLERIWMSIGPIILFMSMSTLKKGWAETYFMRSIGTFVLVINLKKKINWINHLQIWILKVKKKISIHKFQQLMKMNKWKIECKWISLLLSGLKILLFKSCKTTAISK